MKPLDIVRTPKGALALVTETNEEGTKASIVYLDPTNPTDEHCAWWHEGALEGLTVVNSLPRVLALSTCHPLGRGFHDVDKFFPAPLYANVGIGEFYTNTRVRREPK
jgi:hypothetical protein